MRKEDMAEIKMKLKTPTTPNFISIDMQMNVQRQDGFKEGLSISIGDLKDEELIELANEWKIELLAKAKRIRGQK